MKAPLPKDSNNKSTLLDAAVALDIESESSDEEGTSWTEPGQSKPAAKRSTLPSIQHDVGIAEQIAQVSILCLLSMHAQIK